MKYKVPLEELCIIFSDGDWIESKDQSDEGVRLVQTGNVGDGIYIDKEDKARFISEETFERLSCTEVEPGDVLVSRLPDPVARCCIVPELGQKMITAVDCTIIRFKSEILADYFVAYTLTPGYKEQIQSFITGSTRPRISRKNLGQILIPVVSREEQSEFVDFIKQSDKSKFGKEMCDKWILEIQNIYRQGYLI